MRIIIVIAGGLLLGGCFGKPLERQKDKPGWGSIKSDENGVLVARFDAGATDPTTFNASQTSNIPNASVTIPPGALAVSADITIQEGAVLTDATTLAAAGSPGATVESAAPAVDINPSVPMDATGSLAISVPLPATPALALQAADPYQYLVILHKVVIAAEANKVVYGILPRDKITVSGDVAQFVVNHFGTFQAVFLIPADVTAPVVATKTVKAEVKSGKVNISWTAAADDRTAVAALRYAVFYGSAAKLTSVESAEKETKVADYAAGVTTVSLTPPTKPGDHYYNVVVQDEAGNKSIYGGGSVTVADITKPTVVSGTLTPVDVTGNSISLSWTAATDDGTPPSSLTYLVYKMTTASAFNTVTLVKQGAKLATLLDGQTLFDGPSDLTQLTSYTYNVIVKDAAGLEAVYTPVTVSTIDDTPPAITAGSLQGDVLANNVVRLTWTKSVESGLRYKVYRDTTALDDLDAIDEADELATLDDLGLYYVLRSTCAAQTFYYAVVAHDASDNRSLYNDVVEPTQTASGYADGSHQGCPPELDPEVADIDLVASATYVANMVAHNDALYFIRPSAHKVETTPLASILIEDHAGSTAGSGASEFDSPLGMTADGDYIYVADSANNRIMKAHATTGAMALFASLAFSPVEVAIDSTYVYVVDGTRSKIYRVERATPANVSLLVGGSTGFADDPQGDGDAQFDTISSLALYGNWLYVSDTGNQRIRAVDVTTKVVTTLAGSTGGFVDGVAGVNAKFDNPQGIATDGHFLYVADANNNRLRRIHLESTVVTTAAGDGTLGSILSLVSDGDLLTSVFDGPTTVALGGGKIYVGNSGTGVINVITP